jgi:DNA-binding PadR family transcriptional regulator
VRKLLEMKVKAGATEYKLNPLSLYILKSLAEKPKNGYDILKEIRKLTDGKWVPPKSTIYPTLKKMVEVGLLNVDEHGLYTITEDGLRVLKRIRENKEEVDSLRENVRLIEKLIQSVFSEGEEMN